jgi:serine protease Do
VQITSLKPGRLSSQTEVKEGFIIQKVNDRPVKTLEELEKLLSRRKGSGVMLEGIYENVPGKFYYAFGL